MNPVTASPCAEDVQPTHPPVTRASSGAAEGSVSGTSAAPIEVTADAVLLLVVTPAVEDADDNAPTEVPAIPDGAPEADAPPPADALEDADRSSAPLLGTPLEDTAPAMTVVNVDVTDLGVAQAWCASIAEFS